MPIFGSLGLNFDLLSLIFSLFWLGFFLGAPIIGFAYIRGDADQSGQPGWLWALATVFTSWVGVLAYLVVRALGSTPLPRPPR